MNGKLIIFSAPSGSGKSTIIRYLIRHDLPLRFSVSATSRAPRAGEKEGVDYYFLTPEEFREKVAAAEFLEYEEVYPGLFYGTLKSEVERMLAAGEHVVFDVDVVGGCNIKRCYGDRALSIFIRPPSIAVLQQRLEGRNTDSPEVIHERLLKATRELGFAEEFDVIILNDTLAEAEAKAFRIILQFLNT